MRAERVLYKYLDSIISHPHPVAVSYKVVILLLFVVARIWCVCVGTLFCNVVLDVDLY